MVNLRQENGVNYGKDAYFTFLNIIYLMDFQDTGQGLSIAFDAKRAFYNFTGLGNYSRTLLKHLHTYHPDLDLHLFTPSAREDFRTEEFLAEPGYQIHEASYRPGSLWRTLGIGKELIQKGISMYHGLSQELPFKPKSALYKQVVSIHDLIFLHYPNQYRFFDRHIYRKKMEYACKVADVVVVISEATKKDLVEIFGVNPAKVKVIYQSCDDQFLHQKSPEEKIATLTKYKLPAEFILSVGSIIRRKNLLQVIEGMALLDRENRPFLVVVGKGSMGNPYYRTFRERLRELKLEDDVRILEDMDFEDLPTLYQMARFSIYASTYEGFGLPILESLVSGTPVLTSKSSSLPEVAGKGGHYLEENHPVEMAKGIEELLTNEEYWQTLKGEGILQSKKFEGKKITAEWVNLYRGLTSSD